MKKIIFLLVISLSFVYIPEITNAAGFIGEEAVLDCAKAAYKSPMELKAMHNINNPLDSKRILQCKGTTFQEALYQSIVDVKFTEIDLKIEKYLESLKGTSKPVEAVEDIQKKFGLNGEKGSFYNQYNDACQSGIFSYAVEFVNKYPKEFPNIDTNNMSKDYLGGGEMGGLCKTLFKKKLKAYYDAGEVIIVRETVLGYEKSKKEFATKIKEQYRKLLFKMTVYMGQLGVIKDKWNTNTKHPGN